MDRIPVASSNIVSIGYDPDSSILEVEFRNAIYQYFGVPASVFHGLMNAASKGSFFDQYVRKAGYRYSKL
jgi:KTSC domain